MPRRYPDDFLRIQFPWQKPCSKLKISTAFLPFYRQLERELGPTLRSVLKIKMFELALMVSYVVSLIML